jgi:heat shock protein HslJ
VTRSGPRLDKTVVRRARRGVAISLAAAAWLFASGCQTDRSPSGTSAVFSVPGTWRVDEIDGQRVEGAEPPTLSFDGSQRVSGSTGCNRYTAGVTLTGSEIRVGDPASTRMACAPAVMAQEQRFLAALTAVRSHRLDGDAVELLDESGRPRLRLSRS